MTRLVLPALILCACGPPPLPPKPPTPPVTPQVAGASAAEAEGVPASFHGRWDASLAACKSASEMRLTVEPRTLRFWESHADVVGVSPEGPRSARLQVSMTGEGETWTRDIRMALLDDGSLTLDGVKRVRCPA